MTGEVARRSIAERIAALKSDSEAAAEVAVVSLPDATTGTAAFRVAATGELVVDTAAGLAAPEIALDPLEINVGKAHHLLAVPSDVRGEEIEALAVSVWNEAGWTSPGVLHLTDGASLEGPWPLTPATREALNLGEDVANAWILRAPIQRGAVPGTELVAVDEWARAFPQGMPVGAEQSSLLVLRRIARRLGGCLRIAGSGMVLDPDPDSAVNLRIYTPGFIQASRMRELLGGTPIQGASDQVLTQHALTVGEGPQQILIGVRPTDQVPRALRWEDWIKGPLNVFELTWVGASACQLPSGELSRRGRRLRDSARSTIAEAAQIVSEELGVSAVIDEDDFLIDPAELTQPAAEQHP